MTWTPPTPAQAEAGLRALATVARVDGEPTESERALFDAAARALGSSAPLDELASIAPGELAMVVVDAPSRLRVVQALILMTLMDQKVSPEETEIVTRFAAALDVDDARVGNLKQLAAGHTRLLWLDLARRSFARPVFERVLRERGIRGVYEIVGPMVGLARDPDLTRRYNDLGRLEAGTLGRAYWEFIVHNELGFPGEGIVAEEGVWHDLTHVLAGYGVDPLGEVDVVSFIAGYRREDPFFFVFTIALQFHLGIRVSPYSPRETGFFDPERVRRALARGAAVRRDLSVGWDYWPELARPLQDVRRDLGVPPA